MTAPVEPASRSSFIERQIARLVAVERREIAALVISFAFFFSVLTSYYIIRPLRDEMAIMLRQAEGDQALHALLVYVFIVMLAVVPVFGTVVARAPKRWLVPAVYLFFITNLLLFWLVLGGGGQTPRMARIFFIWVSVYNLFIVSLFWSVMSETWASDQAKRLYGFVAAGGSIGAMSGPLIAQSLVHRIGTDNLLLVSALFLGFGLVLSMRLTALSAGREVARAADDQSDHGILAGAMLILKSPYLLAIATWMFLANLILTHFYLEQARIVGDAVTSRTDRVQLLARVDLAANVLTVALQILVTGRFIKSFGIGIATAIVPLVAIVGFMALAVSPTVPVIIAIVVAERALGFAFANPAARVLWTVVDREAKYKAQNFIDTVVFRGGDAASGWVFSGLSKGLGLGGAAIAFVTLPVAIGWLVLSFTLARMHSARGEGSDKPTRETQSQ